MNKCPNCQSDPDETPIFTICTDCQTVMSISQSDIEPSDTHNPEDIKLSVKKGKFESIFSLQDGFEHLYRRVGDVETAVNESERRIAHIEHFLQISIARICPECSAELLRSSSGLLCCSDCDKTYPERPSLDELENE